MKEKFKDLVNKSHADGSLFDTYLPDLVALKLETLDEQDKAYKELQYALLLTRIHKGAAYIDSLKPNDPKRERAMKLYIDLSDQARELRLQL